MLESAGTDVDVMSGTESLSPENGAPGEQVVGRKRPVRGGSSAHGRQCVDGLLAKERIVHRLGQAPQDDRGLAVEHKRFQRTAGGTPPESLASIARSKNPPDDPSHIVRTAKCISSSAIMR